MKFFVAIAISIAVKYCTSEPIMRRSLEDCTFADIFLTKVKGCDIKELYERHKLYDIEEKIIPYVKRNEGVQQRMATALSEFPPECDERDSICKVDETRLCICPKMYVCDPVSRTRIHQCVLLGYYAMTGR